MHNLSRRALLGATLPLALAGCGMTLTQGVALTQQALTDAENALAGFNALIGKNLLGSAATTISTIVGDVVTMLNSLNVGSPVAPTKLSAILTDLQTAMTEALAAAPALASNTYFMAIEAMVTVLSGLWGVSGAFGATRKGTMDPGTATALLAPLPRPALLKVR